MDIVKELEIISFSEYQPVFLYDINLQLLMLLTENTYLNNSISKIEKYIDFIKHETIEDVYTTYLYIKKEIYKEFTFICSYRVDVRYNSPFFGIRQIKTTLGNIKTYDMYLPITFKDINHDFTTKNTLAIHRHYPLMYMDTFNNGFKYINLTTIDKHTDVNKNYYTFLGEKYLYLTSTLELGYQHPIVILIAGSPIFEPQYRYIRYFTKIYFYPNVNSSKDSIEIESLLHKDLAFIKKYPDSQIAQNLQKAFLSTRVVNNSISGVEFTFKIFDESKLFLKEFFININIYVCDNYVYFLKDDLCTNKVHISDIKSINLLDQRCIDITSLGLKEDGYIILCPNAYIKINNMYRSSEYVLYTYIRYRDINNVEIYKVLTYSLTKNQVIRFTSRINDYSADGFIGLIENFAKRWFYKNRIEESYEEYIKRLVCLNYHHKVSITDAYQKGLCIQGVAAFCFVVQYFWNKHKDIMNYLEYSNEETKIWLENSLTDISLRELNTHETATIESALYYELYNSAEFKDEVLIESIMSYTSTKTLYLSQLYRLSYINSNSAKILIDSVLFNILKYPLYSGFNSDYVDKKSALYIETKNLPALQDIKNEKLYQELDEKLILIKLPPKPENTENTENYQDVQQHEQENIDLIDENDQVQDIDPNF